MFRDTMETNERLLLMIPGPTIVDPKVLRAMSKPIMPHREKEFSEMFLEQAERMKQVFRTKNDLFLLAGSGTAAMDAAVSNTIKPGEKVLCIVSGKFSERFTEIVKCYGGEALELNFEWGKEIDVNKVKEALDENNDIKAITVVHNETSTGVKNPIKEIGEIVKETNALLIVDTISSLGGDNINVDEWNIDLCATGSQKCLAIPPGIAAISISEKAWNVIEKTNGYSYYLNLKKYKKHKHHAPYTQPVSMVYGLKVALDMIFEEGLENRIERHRRLAKATREGVKGMGLKLFPEKEEICSNTVTSLRVPKGMDDKKIREIMKDKYNIVIAGGQAHLKGKIMRIGHMGNVSKRDILCTLAALELALKEVGFKIELGNGVRKAQETMDGE